MADQKRGWGPKGVIGEGVGLAFGERVRIFGELFFNFVGFGGACRPTCFNKYRPITVGHVR